VATKTHTITNPKAGVLFNKQHGPNPYRHIDYVNAPTGAYFHVTGMKSDSNHFSTLAEAIRLRDQIERENPDWFTTFQRKENAANAA
jgi:hypothetical protein